MCRSWWLVMVWVGVWGLGVVGGAVWGGVRVSYVFLVGFGAC